MPLPELAAQLRLSEEEAARRVEEIVGRPAVMKRENALTEDIAFWLLTALAFLAPFVVVQTISHFTTIPKRAFIETGALILLGVWFFQGWRAGSLKIGKCAIYLPLGLFLSWGWLSLTWSLSLYDALAYLLLWTACGLVFFVALQYLGEPRRTAALLQAFVLAGVLISLLGILQYLFHLDWFRQAARPAATLGNRNMASHFIVLVFPAALWWFMRAKKAWGIWGSALALAVMAVFLSYTLTRAAWVALGGELVLFFLYLAYERFGLRNPLGFNRPKFIALAAALLLAAVMANLTPGGFEWRGKKLSDSLVGGLVPAGQHDNASKLLRKKKKSVDIRLQLWGNTLAAIKERPLRGFGVDNYKHYYPYINEQTGIDRIKLFREANRAHNEFLQIAAELGLPALAMMAWIGVLGLFRLLRLLRKETPPDNRLLGVAGALALTGICVNACFSFPFYSGIPPLIMAFWGAIFWRVSDAGVEAGPAREKPAYEIPGRHPALMGGAVTGVLLLFNIFVQSRLLSADRLYGWMEYSVKKAKGRDVVDWGAQYMKLNPLDHSVYLLVGQAQVLAGELEAARGSFERYCEYFPYNHTGLYYLGITNYKLQDYSAAEKILLRAARYATLSAEIQNALAFLYQRMERPAEELAAHRRAVEIAPGNSLYQYHLGVAAHRQKKYDIAAGALQRSLEINPRRARAQRLYGIVLYRYLDQQDVGVAHMKQALELDPEVIGAERLARYIEEYERGGKPEIRSVIIKPAANPPPRGEPPN